MLIDDSLYSLKIHNQGHAWQITFNIPEPFHTLSPFPMVVSMLLKHLPIIMECECENGCYHSFKEEVPHTETGHLLEHILLEYLCQHKLDAGYTRAEFSGRTSWNWIKEKRGTFHISIVKKPEDDRFLLPALEQSLNLLKKILSSPSTLTVNSGKQPALGGLTPHVLSSDYLTPAAPSFG